MLSVEATQRALAVVKATQAECRAAAYIAPGCEALCSLICVPFAFYIAKLRSSLSCRSRLLRLSHEMTQNNNPSIPFSYGFILAQASTYAFSELTFSHHGCQYSGGGPFMPAALDLLYGSLATTGLRLSDSSSLEEQRVKLIAELNRTHAWACNRKRVYILVSTLVLAHCET